MVRAEDGRIFVGTDNLVEFDGLRWTVHRIPGVSEVRALTFDRTGRLWVGGRNEIGVFDFRSGSGDFRSATGQLNAEWRQFGDLWGLYPHRDGVVAVTARAVMLFGLGTARVWPLPTERRLFPFTSGGRIYISQPGVGLWRVAGSNLEQVDLPDELRDEEICWADNLADPQRWVAITTQGLVGGSLVAGEAESRLNRVLRHSAPTHAQRLADGRIAISTWLAGVLICDDSGRLIQHLSPRSGLPGANVVSTVPEADGSFWIVATTGFGRHVTGQRTLQHDLASGFAPSRWHGIVERADETLLATDAGLWSVRGDDKPMRRTTRIFHRFASFPELIVAGGFQGLHGIAGQQANLLHWDANDVVAVVASRSITHRVYFAAHRSLRWGEVRGESILIAPGQFDVGETVSHLAEDHTGHIWALTANGRALRLRHLPPDTDEFTVEDLTAAWSEVTGAPVRDLFPAGDRVYALAGSRLWLIDTHHGRLRPIDTLNQVQVLAATADPASAAAWALVRPLGHAQVSPSLVRIDPISEFGTQTQPLDRLARRQIGEPTSLHTTVDNAGQRWLWVAGTHGGVRLPVTSSPRKPAEDRFSVTSIHVRERQRENELPPEATLVLGSSTRTIAFYWMAGGAPVGEVAFESRLLGADDTWRSDGLTWTREFTGLPAGRYTFELRTRDALGQPSPVQRVAFIIPAPWYLTRAAYLGYAFAAAGLGWGLIVVRTRRIRRRAEELETMVRRRTEQLARANTEKTRFLARMNHEIRNPLNGLVGVIGILEHTPFAQREAKLFGVLRACADQLTGVVDGVLDFASVESGRIVIRERAFPVSETLGLVRQVFMSESMRTATEVEVQIGAGLPPVLVGDPDRIRQVLVNFLGNALKFAPGRPVTITAAPMLEGDPAAPRVRFTVRDQGPGIPAEEQANLFSLFVRGEMPQRRGIRGTGIGLATCRLLAERMGGRVGVESEVGRGAAFYLELPMQIPPGGRLPFDAQDPCGEVFGLPCLVVDDEEFNRLVLRDLLERLGCRVDEAATAADALRLFGTNAYRVVFVDLDLPDAAPGELLHTLRRTRPLDGVPPPALVVTTAYATENVRHTCLEAGAFDFLAKPLGAARLADVLRRVDARLRPAAGVEVANESVPESRGETLRRLAAARGGSVADLIADIEGDLAFEAGALQDAALAGDARRCGHHAHRLLSLAALLSAPMLARAAGDAQSATRRGAVPATEAIAAIAHAVQELRASLTSFDPANAPLSRNPSATRNE